MEMKKLVIILLGIVVIGALITSGCGESTTPAAQTTTQTTTQTATQTTTQITTKTTTQTVTTEAKPIELKFSAFCVPEMGIGQVLQQTADRIYAKSNGRLKVTVYWGEALSKMLDNSKAVQSGIADMSEYNIGSSAGLQELSRVLQLPFMGHTSYKEANAVFYQLYNKYPEIQAEWQGIKVLGVRAMVGYHLFFTNKEVHLPADMKGLKMISDQAWVELLNGAGAAPVQIGYGDWYTSLERGLVQGIPTHFVAAYAMKFLDLVPYVTVFGDVGASNSQGSFLMSLDTWNSLPADLQAVVQEAADWWVQAVTDSDSAEQVTAISYAKEKGFHLTYLTAEEIQQWQDLAMKTEHAKWLENNASKGGQKIYDDAIKMIKEYK
jgi:TRAP-type C4-dicarboxylate transport system substrate-binding protein